MHANFGIVRRKTGNTDITGDVCI